jgi:hypothetical protein
MKSAILYTAAALFGIIGVLGTSTLSHPALSRLNWRNQSMVLQLFPPLAQMPNIGSALRPHRLSIRSSGRKGVRRLLRCNPLKPIAAGATAPLTYVCSRGVLRLPSEIPTTRSHTPKATVRMTDPQQPIKPTQSARRTVAAAVRVAITAHSTSVRFVRDSGIIIFP